MPQSNDLLKVQIDSLKENLLQQGERIVALERANQTNLQWANDEHWKMRQEIIEQGKKIRNDLVMEGKDMRVEVQSDIQEIKEWMKSRDSNVKQTVLTLIGPFLSTFLMIIAYAILHAVHII